MTSVLARNGAQRNDVAISIKYFSMLSMEFIIIEVASSFLLAMTGNSLLQFSPPNHEYLSSHH
ncbi:hypothetical protein MTP09_13670 [Chryseobacterium suipulveris]|uniref:Uncharacterized protein n=1 Tax=Chryseobacterium suipulveris TaxID=2929800 RepID=A0ABY4BQA8_9FLAO|nr:hypothetical protein [Chryseobacterium suipulveris]UOE40934.1 hypothetical protein MTP09_13670 [Chryseobacterium suipulveris]